MPNTKVCPKCGDELTFGYGLAGGGGIAPYELCLNDACDYFNKDKDEANTEPGQINCLHQVTNS